MTTGHHPAPSVIFAGGGTGGHIFPALAIAEQISARAAGAPLRFIVSQRPLDARILEREKIGGAQARFDTIAAQPFSMRPGALMRFLSNWGHAVRQSRDILQQEQASGQGVVLVAMGGFVAAPAVQAARVEHVPVVLVNLDAVPGKANLWIAKRAHACVTSARIEGHDAWESIPPIVRAGIASRPGRAEACAALGVDPARRVLMVTGGSQGAGSINALMAMLAGECPDAYAGWHVLHQTGKGSAESVRAAYERAGVSASVCEFVHDIGVWWACADLCVSRSGAGNVAEVWATKVPAVFLPYPHHKDQHQRRNAQALEAAGGAVVSCDEIDARLNMKSAGVRIAHLLRDAARRTLMRAGLDSLGPADGATKVADKILSLRRL